MSLLETGHLRCPYCGEPNQILIDCSIQSQSYIEDCQVCCRPMSIRINQNSAGRPQPVASREDEVD